MGWSPTWLANLWFPCKLSSTPLDSTFPQQINTWVLPIPPRAGLFRPNGKPPSPYRFAVEPPILSWSSPEETWFRWRDLPFHSMIWAICCNLTRQSQWQKDFSYYCPLKTHSTCISNLSSVVETPFLPCFVMRKFPCLAGCVRLGLPISPLCDRNEVTRQVIIRLVIFNEKRRIFGYVWPILRNTRNNLVFLIPSLARHFPCDNLFFSTGFVATTGHLHGWMVGTRFDRMAWLFGPRICWAAVSFRILRLCGCRL